LVHQHMSIRLRVCLSLRFTCHWQVRSAGSSRRVHDERIMEPSDALHALSTFRRSFYECLHRRGDALFELTDALLTADSVPSPVHLSLQTSHRRGWGSLYAALDRVYGSTPKPCGGCSPTIRSPAPQGRRPSTPWTRACGIAATPRRAPSEDSTTTLPATRRGS
jgi:hypothetical protein